MKKSKRIALCGMLSALSLVIMLVAYFPYLTYTLPALAGIMFTDLVHKQEIEFSFKTFMKYGSIISIPTLLVSLLMLSIVL